MSFDPQRNITITFRHLGSAILDGLIEISGGILGCYFGALVAALMTTLSSPQSAQNPEILQKSIWLGLGYGFAFWMLAVSFVNRVLIQGLSRSTLGMKVFELELISAEKPYTWNLVLYRWILSEISMVLGGVGYLMMFFNRAQRALPDLILETDVVPMIHNNAYLSVQYQDEVMKESVQKNYQMDNSNTFLPVSRMIVLNSTTAERPMATIIKLPVREVPIGPASESLAATIQIDDQKKKAA
jgi:hypothetical protein